MDERKNTSSGEEGLGLKTPLGGPIGSIPVGSRPVDPVLVDRLETMMKGLGDKGITLPGDLSLSVRSMDGFYHIEEISGVLFPESLSAVSVVQYDPVRRTFMLGSRNGEPSADMELVWYAFEVFSDQGMILIDKGKDAGYLDPPGESGPRAKYYLALVSRWKDENPLLVGGTRLWRVKGMKELSALLEKEFSSSPEDQ